MVSHLFEYFALRAIHFDNFEEDFFFKMINEINSFVNKINVKILDAIIADV